MSDESDGKVTNRASGHRAQCQKSFAHAVYEEYRQNVTSHSGPHVDGLQKHNIVLCEQRHVMKNAIFL